MNNKKPVGSLFQAPLIKTVPRCNLCIVCRHKSKKTHGLHSSEIMRLWEDERIYADPEHRWRICNSCGTDGKMKESCKVRSEEKALDPLKMYKFMMLLTEEARRAKMQITVKDKSEPWWCLKGLTDEKCQKLVFLKVSTDKLF